MLYVAAGLSLMFGAIAFLGLGAIDQATQLVYRERLSTAYTTAAFLDRDLAQVAADAREEGEELSVAGDGPIIHGAAAQLLARFEEAATYRFFRVTGVWIVDPTGSPLDAAGLPAPATEQALAAGSALTRRATTGYAVDRPVAPIAGAVGFASLAVALNGGFGSRLALVHLASINATVDYSPVAFGQASPGPAPVTDSGATGYHLEVVDPQGIAVLGIGSDERPGEPSYHYERIRTLMADGAAAALLHEPGPGESFEPHVMAVVPLPSTPMYVVLEQPTDVALALPHELQTRLFVTIGLGFVAALGVAWVTTRHVVKPTERLTAAAGLMAAGDLASPIDVEAEDEVGRLAESLEVMRRQLAAARDDLEKTNRSLERRVVERTARLNQVLGQTINAQEEERRRLARELHDETAQTLAALTITLDRARDDLDRARNDVDGSSSDALAHIGQARAAAARLLAETRRLILGLRPAVLDDLGLLPAIRWYAETTLEAAGIELAIEASEAPARLPSYMEVALFRIVQEAITNVARHARAHHAMVRIAFEAGSVSVTISDDGVGFDVDRAARQLGPAASVGLIGMQERVRLLDGEIEIHSSPRGGTMIVVRVPFMPEAT